MTGGAADHHTTGGDVPATGVDGIGAGAAVGAASRSGTAQVVAALMQGGDATRCQCAEAREAVGAAAFGEGTSGGRQRQHTRKRRREAAAGVWGTGEPMRPSWQLAAEGMM